MNPLMKNLGVTHSIWPIWLFWIWIKKNYFIKTLGLGAMIFVIINIITVNTKMRKHLKNLYAAIFHFLWYKKGFSISLDILFTVGTDQPVAS